MRLVFCSLLFFFYFFVLAAPPSPQLLKKKKRLPQFKTLPHLSIEGKIRKEKAVLPLKKAQISQGVTPSQEKIVVIMVEFPEDAPPPGKEGDNPAQTFSNEHTTDYFYRLIFSKQPRVRSLRNYYYEVSYGNVEINGEEADIYGPYTLDHCLAYYGENNGEVIDAGWSDDNGTLNNSTLSHRLIIDAVKKADKDVNFSLYDTNPSDGVVDHLIVIHAGGAEESTGESKDIWSLQYNGLSYNTNDGVKIERGIIVSQDSPLGIFAHEFGHDLGLPDLSDSTRGEYTPDPVGIWCLMGYGCWAGGEKLGDWPTHICGYLKIYKGWITPTTVSPTNDGDYPLGEVETNKWMYKIMINEPNEYFLIENRYADSSSAIFDKRIMYNEILYSGLIITHVNENRENNEVDAENNPDSYKVWIENPVSSFEKIYKQDAAYAADHGRFSFTPQTTPNTNDNAGNRTGISISNVSYAGETMTFTIGIPPAAPTGLSASSSENSITLTWSANSESDLEGYNVYRSTTSGKNYKIINPELLPSDTLTYTDTSLEGETTYFYVVTAVDKSSNESNYSSEVSGRLELPSDGDGGKCFIATACFGSPQAEEVKILSQFRDRYLLKNSLGKKLVFFYYQISPPLANFISKHPYLKALTRICLRPVIGTVRKILKR